MVKTFKYNNGAAAGSYLAAGEGKPVILLHGFAEDHTIWEHQTAFLRSAFQVIVPDLPGTGGSELTSPLTIESMAEFVHGLFAAEQIDKAVVIGHSMGGYVALAFAEKYPELLTGLGLFSSTAQPDSEEKKEGRQKSIRMMQQYGNEAFLRQMLPNMFAPSFRSAQAARIEQFIQQAIQVPLPSLIAYYEAMMVRPDRTNILSAASVPVLFFIGKEDQAVPPDNALSQVSLPAISSIHIFDHVGHMGLLETFEESNIILQHFISFCEGKS